jgi:hypothetical protein
MGEIEIRTNKYTCIPITQKTLEKIKAYAKISGDNECYGFLISPKKSEDGIIYNAILAPGQEVSGAHAGINAVSAANAKAEIENMGYKSMGFWHSHGSFGVFHSGVDDGNMERLILSFAGNTEEKSLLESKTYRWGRTEDSQIIIKQGDLEIKVELDKKDTSFRVEPTKDVYSELILGITKDKRIFVNDGLDRLIALNPKNISIDKCNGKSYKVTGVAYSIVTNQQGSIYGEIGISKWCNVCERLEKSINKKANWNIVGVREDIEFEQKDLEKEFSEKVEGYKTRKGWLSRW